MIIVLKPNQRQETINEFVNKLTTNYDVQVNTWVGTQSTVLGLIGDTTAIDSEYVAAQEFVESVKRVQEPYKKANRKFHPDNTVISLPTGQKIGDGSLALIAGPCSVESEDQICEIAESVKRSGAMFLRGGAFKPRTSPYAFQGMKAEGLELLSKAKKKTGLPIVTEIMSIEHLPLFEDVDIIQVGARNMQNFELLRQLGKTRKPILLKRGLANTIEELLMSAEYIMAEGNEQVILCERGIRTYETMTRNTLDISAVPVIKKLSHLPVIVDPSHASGINWLIEPLAIAAAAIGADGLIIEVHNDPSHALCDGAQSITPVQFDALAAKVKEAFRNGSGAMKKKIVLVGLGLIGGSLAKALKLSTEHEVLGVDISDETLLDACSCGAIDRKATLQDLEEADMIYLCVYPEEVIRFIEEYGKRLKSDCIVTDTCGIKKQVCRQMNLLQANGNFIFVGGHPMAGKERSGFSASDPSIFVGASYLITPCGAPEWAVEEVSSLAKGMGFGRVVLTTPEKHDQIIAFTSQVPHVLACAYVMSPRCREHQGFSAGSYRDVSRVALINDELWSRLFLDNREALLREIDTLIGNLEKLRDAVAGQEEGELRGLLQAAARIKQEEG